MQESRTEEGEDIAAFHSFLDWRECRRKAKGEMMNSLDSGMRRNDGIKP